MTEQTNGGGEAANSALIEVGQASTRAFAENRLDLEQELGRIQRDQDLSDSAKSRLSEEARKKASARHAEILSEHEKATSELLENNEKKLFKLQFPESAKTPSEIQQFRNSYRDCCFKVLNLDEESLSRVMTRAQRVGDSALEQSAYHEAIERGLFSVAGEYRERHPDARDVWETYQKTRLSEDAHGAALTRALLATADPGS
jgi:hypothetical protein